MERLRLSETGKPGKHTLHCNDQARAEHPPPRGPQLGNVFGRLSGTYGSDYVVTDKKLFTSTG